MLLCRKHPIADKSAPTDGALSDICLWKVTPACGYDGPIWRGPGLSGDDMKAWMSRVTLVALVGIHTSAAAETISQEQLASYCAASASTSAKAHAAREQGVPLETALKEIDVNVRRGPLADEDKRLTEAAYAEPEHAMYIDFYAVAMKECVASRKVLLPMTDSPAVLLWKAPLKFPYVAVRERHEGAVMLLVKVNADSSIEKVEVTKSSGFEELDKAARKNAESAEFRALIANGQFATSYVRFPVTFSLGVGATMALP